MSIAEFNTNNGKEIQPVIDTKQEENQNVYEFPLEFRRELDRVFGREDEGEMPMETKD